MPILRHSNFNAPWYQRDGHLQTIVPALSRYYRNPGQIAIDIPAKDGFLIESDLYRKNSGRLAILSHGLEGNARRYYMTGMAKRLLADNWDVLCWNYRTCGKRLPDKPIFYHAGFTDDLEDIIRYAIDELAYKEIVLIGFSIGGNITFKLAGEKKNDLPSEIKALIGVSVPCDLAPSSRLMGVGFNRLYGYNFLRTMKKKVEILSVLFPEIINVEDLKGVYKMEDFDELYTAPMNGFKSAKDYYLHSSSIYFLPEVNIPSYIISAENDPYLEGRCYPEALARKKKNIFLEISELGGHVGFESQDGTYWHEERISKFIKNGYEFSDF